MTHWTDRLIAIGETGSRPRSDVVEWAREYLSLEAAWAACERGDWMLWLAGRLTGPPWSGSPRPLVRAAALCAELAVPYARDEWVEGVVLSTLQTAVAWSEREASDEELRAADAAAYSAAAYSAAAYSAAYSAAAYSAAYFAAYSAAYAAYFATYAAYAACAAYAAANASAYAADAADDARALVLAQCADIVRANLPCPVLP